MAYYAYASYVANGTNSMFSVPFAYIQKADVQAFVNGVQDTGITWPDSSTVQLSSTPAANAVVVVKRVTPRTANVTFNDASTLTASNLNNNTKQLIYLVQEQLDAASLSIVLGTDGNWDAQSRTVEHVATPVNTTDAVNKSYADAVITTAQTSATDAATSKSAADADVVLTHADVVLTHADVTAAAASASSAAAALANALTKANNLSDVASASTSRANLGLGTMATQNASAVNITGGTAILSTTQITGLTATLIGTLTAGAQIVDKGQYRNPQGAVNALGSITGTVNVDLTTGSIITGTLTGNTTLVFGNNSSYATSGVYQSWEARINTSTFTLTLQRSTGNATTWDSVLGAPTLVASKVAVITFETTDGGATVTSSYVGSF